MTYIPTKTRTWSRTTPADGDFIDDEIDRIYANANHNKSSIDAILTDIIEIGCFTEDPFRQKDPARYKITDGASYNRSEATVLMGLLLKTVTSMVPGTDRINIATHGKSEGEKVKFSFTAGGIVAQQEYYVRNPNTDDMQVSLTKSGAILDITSDGTGEMITNVEWGFGNGSTTYNVPDRRGKFKRVSGVSGTHQKANGGYFDGGAVGETKLDLLQGHWHRAVGKSANTLKQDDYSGGGTAYVGSASVYVYEPTSNGVDGTPRTGDETNPVYISILEVVRVA